MPENSAVAGPAELHSGDRTVSISIGDSARARRAAIALEAGAATLRGESIVVETPPARVTTLSPDAEVEVAMNAKKVGATVIAAGAAVLSVHVLRGIARIEPVAGATTQQPTLLAQGDRALVTARRPPAILRASHPAAPTAAATVQRPSEKPVAIQAPPSEPPAPGQASLTGSLDKDTIRAGIQSIIPRIRECYEQGVARNPQLGGRVVVKFVIRTKDRHGRIDEAEIDPENDELQSPLDEQCILNAIADLDFPAPSGGGEVRVSYPFVFATAGEP